MEYLTSRWLTVPTSTQSRVRKVWENSECPTLHHEQTLKDKKVGSYFLLTFFQDKEGEKGG